MTLKRKIIICTTLMAVALFAVAATGFADTKSDLPKAAITFKAPQLKDWQSATMDERSSFLVGVVTMFEVEREWQTPAILPLEQSSIGVWTRGLMGVTFRDMHNAIDSYIAENPDKMDEQVMTVLGRAFVRPVLTEKELDYASKRYEEKNLPPNN